MGHNSRLVSKLIFIDPCGNGYIIWLRGYLPLANIGIPSGLRG
ncbi:hypothetical protein BHECKSOX2_973 [Bathymodiolus heckerae thiotrophic gill symbiont]|nr:hypothetical protein BHECKSOX2_973 [Bathymodiolus heckerae thiotrophic gill symbiont]SMN15976.1 hypothetical protein CRYPD_815 [uncultured Candidatus Thioglobus sp.]